MNRSYAPANPFLGGGTLQLDFGVMITFPVCVEVELYPFAEQAREGSGDAHISRSASFATYLITSDSISRTVAVVSGPQHRNLAPFPCILLKSSFPLISM